MIARNGEQPRGELGLSLKRIQTLISLDRDFLGEVGSRLAVGGKAKAPACHPGEVAPQQLIDKEFAFAGIGGLSITSRQLLVRKLFEGHPANYSNACRLAPGAPIRARRRK